MERITPALLGAGAALLAFGVEPGTLVATIALGAAFFGVHRATGNKLVVGSLALLAMSWAGRRAASLLRDYDLESPALLVGWVASAAFVVAFVVAVVAAHERVGRALAGLVAASGALAIAGGAAATLGALARPSSPEGQSVEQLALWISQGHGEVSSLLAGVALAVAAVGPKVEGQRAPAPLALGAAGAMLLATTLAAVEAGEPAAGHSPIAALAWLATMALGWALMAVGMAALARSGVRAAWAGVALAIVELLVCTPTVVLGGNAIDDDVGFALLPLFFGLVGVAVTWLADRGTSLRVLRASAGGLVLVGVLGSCAATALVAAGIDAIGLRFHEPLAPLESARHAAACGLALTAAVLALLATPPREPA